MSINLQIKMQGSVYVGWKEWIDKVTLKEDRHWKRRTDTPPTMLISAKGAREERMCMRACACLCLCVCMRERRIHGRIRVHDFSIDQTNFPVHINVQTLHIPSHFPQDGQWQWFNIRTSRFHVHRLESKTPQWGESPADEGWDNSRTQQNLIPPCFWNCLLPPRPHWPPEVTIRIDTTTIRNDASSSELLGGKGRKDGCPRALA